MSNFKQILNLLLEDEDNFLKNPPIEELMKSPLIRDLAQEAKKFKNANDFATYFYKILDEYDLQIIGVSEKYNYINRSIEVPSIRSPYINYSFGIESPWKEEKYKLSLFKRKVTKLYSEYLDQIDLKYLNLDIINNENDRELFKTGYDPTIYVTLDTVFDRIRKIYPLTKDIPLEYLKIEDPKDFYNQVISSGIV